MDLDNMTGTGAYAGGHISLNTVSLNGDGDIKEVAPGEFKAVGGYYRKTLTATQKKGEKPGEERLGEEVKIILLKVRRTLSQRTGDKVIRWTTEHNTPEDMVSLYDESGLAETGTARALREKYDGLRTIQIIYGLLLDGIKEPEMVRLRIKGSALGSENKPEGVLTFYEYVASFGNEVGEKMRNYVTVLGSAKESGKKDYFTMDFKKGQKLSPEMQEIADRELVDIHTKLTAQDEQRRAKMRSSSTPVTQEPNQVLNSEEPQIEYPGDDINPEDIPF